MRPSSPSSLPSLEQILAEKARRGLSGPEARFARFQVDPAGYSQEFLGITPWKGIGEPGQAELFADIGESVKRQLQGLPAPKIFRVEAGHGVGKTYGAAALVNWFFDCFGPSVITTTAPTSEQVTLLLWKDIKTQREGRGLPGRVLPEESRMVKTADWFAFGRTTSDAKGKGSERAQGQHNKYALFVLDEAEGVPDFFFDAVDAMMTGGTVTVVLMLANPKTRSSRFHKMGRKTGVKNYRLSVLNHPNVVHGREIVEGATRREWATEKILQWCEPVTEPSPDDYTFSVGFDIENEDGGIIPAGTIFKPNAEFCFRVMGVAPASLADDVFVSSGRYEGATKNAPLAGEEHRVRYGVDCARYGADMGTIYRRHGGEVRLLKQVAQGNTQAYVAPIREDLLTLAALGVTDAEVRIDGTGGFGAGVVDGLQADLTLREAFTRPEEVAKDDPRQWRFEVREVHFGSSAYASDKYADKVTEMYAEAGETLKALRIGKVPAELETDLTERKYGHVNREGRSLKKLVEKEKFRKDNGRSPDDGDGFVLAVGPDFIFEPAFKIPDSIFVGWNK